MWKQKPWCPGAFQAGIYWLDRHDDTHHVSIRKDPKGVRSSSAPAQSVGHDLPMWHTWGWVMWSRQESRPHDSRNHRGGRRAHCQVREVQQMIQCRSLISQVTLKPAFLLRNDMLCWSILFLLLCRLLFKWHNQKIDAGRKGSVPNWQNCKYWE